MTISELLQRAIRVEDFNTNNGWGFGGAVGKRHFFTNNVCVTVGRADYRHTPSSHFVSVSHNDTCIMDVNRLSPENIEKIISLITPANEYVCHTGGIKAGVGAH